MPRTTDVEAGYADRYSDLQELDAATVNQLIEKIVIHSPEKIGGKKHIMTEVYFTYVGKIRIPLSKPKPLTAMEKPARLPPRRFHQKLIYFLISLCQRPTALQFIFPELLSGKQGLW